ncbi:hypothetical protein [Mycolicibacterium fortuitum]|uniref:hypothetical protein n=1 Tax=Mycolicibacterium fortuitum TaxID=1766 RepID=UPI00241FA85F|nr:hypothetical protein [Mycolicibacterium fortuitum]MDG5782988.1 hypothetical protein [Mycolicibacterium fortuitum]
MQLALRPFTTAGIALVGAGVIAVSPLAPPPVATSATTTMSAASVALTASSSFVDPIAYWGEVLELAGTNLSTHFEAAIADPFPVLGQVVENQVGYANTIITALSTTSQRLDAFVKGAYFAGQIEKIKTQLAAGNVASAAQAINGIVINGAIAFYPLLDMTKIPGQIGQNVANVLQTLAMESLTNVGIPGRLGFGALELARNTLASFAWTTQTIVTAAKSGDALAKATASPLLAAVTMVCVVQANEANVFRASSSAPNPSRPGMPTLVSDSMASVCSTFATFCPICPGIFVMSSSG